MNDGLHRRPNKPKSTWYFYYRGSDLRFHERSTRTDNYNEARTVRTRFLAELEQYGPLCDRASLTFEQAGELWARTRICPPPAS